MDREYYKKYYTFEREHWWFRVRAEIIRERIENAIQPNDKLRILNIGAATGRSSELLAQYGHVTSVEYDADCCTFLLEQLKMEVTQASITELPFMDNSFDLVCAFDVIEHVEDDEKALDELFRVCSKNGNIVITVPAFMQLWSRHDVVNHHKRRYLLSSLKKQVLQRRGEIIFASNFNSLLFVPVFLARKWMNLFPGWGTKNRNESDFVIMNNPFMNAVLHTIFSMEVVLLRIMRFPLGVSAILVSKKTG